MGASKKALLAVVVASGLYLSSGAALAEQSKPEYHLKSVEICRPIQVAFGLQDPYLVDLQPVAREGS